MNHQSRPTKLILTLATIVSLSGCATGKMGITESQTGKSEKTSIADEITAKVDKLCPIPGKAADKNYWELRYIRAQIILSAIARYGAARIEDYYGGEKDIRGAYLLAKVNNSATAIRKAQAHSKEEIALHNIDTADVIDNLLRTAGAAMTATTDKIKSFALAPNFKDGRDFLINALEDALYVEAYKKDCASLMEEGQDESKVVQIQKTVNAHLALQCNRVSDMTGLPNNCEVK